MSDRNNDYNNIYVAQNHIKSGKMWAFGAIFGLVIAVLGVSFGGGEAWAYEGGTAGKGNGTKLYSGDIAPECYPQDKPGWATKASYTCWASFRLYKWDTIINQSDLDEAISSGGGDADVYADVRVSVEGDDVKVARWGRKNDENPDTDSNYAKTDGSPMAGGTISGCRGSGYYLRFGYEMIGGANGYFGGNGKPTKDYQVGLGQVNALMDTDTIPNLDDRKRQTLMEVFDSNYGVDLTWYNNVNVSSGDKYLAYAYANLGGRATPQIHRKYTTQDMGDIEFDGVLNLDEIKLSSQTSHPDYAKLQALAEAAYIQYENGNNNEERYGPGVPVGLDLAAKIFRDLHEHDMLDDDWEFASSSDVWSPENGNYLPLLTAYSKESGSGVGYLCIDLEQLKEESDFISTKSGIQFRKDGQYRYRYEDDNAASATSDNPGDGTNVESDNEVDDGLPQKKSNWTARSTDESGSHVANMALEIPANRNQDTVTVAFRHAILFGLQKNRPEDNCIYQPDILSIEETDTDPRKEMIGALTWPIQNPSVQTLYIIGTTENETNDFDASNANYAKITSGTMSTMCYEITGGFDELGNRNDNEGFRLYNGDSSVVPNKWRAGNGEDAAGQWVFDFIHTVTIDVSELRAQGGGVIKRCETIRHQYNNLTLTQDGDLILYPRDREGLTVDDIDMYNTGDWKYTTSCVTITVDTPTEPTGPVSCLQNYSDSSGRVAITSNLDEYGNTTGFSGVRNLSNALAHGYGNGIVSGTVADAWFNTTNLQSNEGLDASTIKNSHDNAYVYAKPGDSVQFHHCLTYGAQSVKGNGESDTGWPNATNVPPNQVDFSVNIETSDGESHDYDSNYLFRDLQQRPYNENLSQKTFSVDHDFPDDNEAKAGTSLDQYAFMFESPSPSSDENGNSSYRCDFYSDSDKYNIRYESPGYQVHNFIGVKTNCAASQPGDASSGGVAYQDTGKIITQYYDWDDIVAWRAFTPAGDSMYGGDRFRSVFQEIFGGDDDEDGSNGGICDGECDGIGNAWHRNYYNTSITDAIEHEGNNYMDNYHCDVSDCTCPDCDDEEESCECDEYNYGSDKLYTVYSNVYGVTCENGQEPSKSESDGAPGNTCRNSPKKYPVNRGKKSASVVVPYNFQTAVSAYAGAKSTSNENPEKEAPKGVVAGTEAETTVEMRVLPRVNPDVNGNSEYATIMPEKSKIQIVEFVLDDDTSSDIVNQPATDDDGNITGYAGIAEGYLNDNAKGDKYSDGICAYFRAAIKLHRDSDGNELSRDCNLVREIKRDDETIKSNLNNNKLSGFNVRGELTGDTGSNAKNAYSATFNTTVPDVEVGQKYCVAIGVYPADSHNKPLPGESALGSGVNGTSTKEENNGVDGVHGTGTMWHISTASCRTITKQPTFQVWNGDVETQNIDTSVTSKFVGTGFTGIANGNVKSTVGGKKGATRKSSGGNNYIFGSWDEYNVIAGGDVANFSSGAAVGYNSILLPQGGLSGDVAPTATRITNEKKQDMNPLTIANQNDSYGGSGIYSVDSPVSPVVARLTSKYLAPLKGVIGGANSFEEISTGGNSNTGNNQKVYKYMRPSSNEVGDITVARFDANYEYEDPTYVIYVEGDLTITGNICYQGNASCIDTGVKTAYTDTKLGGTDNIDARPDTNSFNVQNGSEDVNGKTGQNAYNSLDYNLLENGDDYSAITELPQVLIFADNINIASNVTQIDAWLIALGDDANLDSLSETGTMATGKIDTCSDFNDPDENATNPDEKYGTSADNASQCANQLVVNGPVFAGTIHFNRTAGAYPGSGIREADGVNDDGTPNYSNPTKQNIANDGSITPAEIFNLRADAYLWAYSQAQDTRQASTTYTRELPPRY